MRTLTVRRLAPLFLVALLVGSVAASTADAVADRGPRAAVRWLEATQNADGGFGRSPGEPSQAAVSGWVALGLAAAGRNPRDVNNGGRSLTKYLIGEADLITTDGDLARTILVAHAAGLDPRNFGGRDLVTKLLRRAANGGSYGTAVGTTAFAAMALRVARERRAAQRARAWLHGAQNSDGGWGLAPGVTSEADLTGAATQALAGSAAAQRGAAYLRKVQLPGGGYGLAGSRNPNVPSTAWAMQGLLAVGQRGTSGPADYLAARQAGDGHYRYSSSSDQSATFTTAQALAAVKGQPFPVSPVPAARRTSPAEAADRKSHPKATPDDRQQLRRKPRRGRTVPKRSPQSAADELAPSRPASTSAEATAPEADDDSERRLLVPSIAVLLVTALAGGGYSWRRRR